MSAVAVVDAYLATLLGSVRRLAHAEWGLTVEAGAAAGHPLDIGIRVADELLRAQALAVPAEAGLDPWVFLHWNRQARLVRFASTRAGDLWIHADTPVAGLDARGVDRLLGLLVQGAARAREYAAAVAAAGKPARTASEADAARASGHPGGGPAWLSAAARPRAAG